ncbi:MAG: DUF3054 domain-containing protein [Chloroflexota bacterium]|nr:DUF3054 domain-containing protein [Chloroflexota bacterium]
MRLSTRTAPRSSVGLLVLGDVLALAAFIAVGLANHNRTENLLADITRIGAPFLLGWFALAALLGAYRPAQGRGSFMLRSALAWALGIGAGLLLRNTVFGSNFSPIFAIISYVFTGLFLIGWRGLYALIFGR